MTTVNKPPPGEVFERDDTFAAMLAVSPQSAVQAQEGCNGYGMGIAHSRHRGVICFGDGGFCGTAAWHCPAIH